MIEPHLIAGDDDEGLLRQDGLPYLEVPRRASGVVHDAGLQHHNVGVIDSLSLGGRYFSLAQSQ